MNTANIRGIIFDVDGVIADTTDFHYRAWLRLAEEENIPFSRETYFQQMAGTKREENLRVFTEGLDIDEATKQAWMERKQSYYTEFRDQLAPKDVLPGVVRIIEEAKAANLKIGVGSASKNAREVLENLQLLNRFDAFCDGFIPSNSKPAPDIFLWVAGALGLPPRNILVFEDSLAGVQAARTGGFYVIGLNSRPLENAHAQVPSLADANLADLMLLLAD